MFYKSFWEMAAEEKALCDEIQLQINILAAAEQAEAEGIDTKKHAGLLAESGKRLEMAMPKLHRIRTMIGARMMMCQESAEKLIRERLNEPGGDGR